MASGTNQLAFQLYRNAARTQIWGQTAGTDTLGGTGTGTVATVNVYGRIPTQLTPPAGAYETQITATISY
jgi:spore coat protein U-like protein